MSSQYCAHSTYSPFCLFFLLYLSVMQLNLLDKANAISRALVATFKANETNRVWLASTTFSFNYYFISRNDNFASRTRDCRGCYSLTFRLCSKIVVQGILVLFNTAATTALQQIKRIERKS